MSDSSQSDPPSPPPQPQTPAPTIKDYYNMATDSAITALANLRPHHFHDRAILLPIIEQTNFLYTKHGLTPNQITIFNGTVVSTALLYSVYAENLFAMMFFMFIRNILDGADGYIARKHDLTSLHGDIFDHVFDTATMNAGVVFVLSRYMSLPWSLIWGHFQIVGCTIIQFDPRFKEVRWLFGAENYDFPMLMLNMMATIIVYMHI